MSILDDMSNPHLFASEFRGDTWDAWKAFLAALFALEMTPEMLAKYRQHTGRNNPPTEPFSECTVIVGRRGGKSRILALVGVYLAVARNYLPYLGAGEKATIAIIAADRDQARSIYNYAYGFFTEIPALASKVKNITSDAIELQGRVVIEIRTASKRGARSYSYAAILADESAWYQTDENSANQDVEIFAALRPGMATIPGSIFLNASSPYRRQGVLWDSYKENYGRDDSDTLVWKASTVEMHDTPAIRAVVAKAYAKDPARASAEHGANFRTDLEAFISQEVVDGCTDFGCYERPPAQSLRHRYFGFVDAAGGSGGGDSFAMAIAHAEGENVVLDAIRERKPPFSPASVVGEFVPLLKDYGVSKVEASTLR